MRLSGESNNSKRMKRTTKRLEGWLAEAAFRALKKEIKGPVGAWVAAHLLEAGFSQAREAVERLAGEGQATALALRLQLEAEACNDPVIGGLEERFRAFEQGLCRRFEGEERIGSLHALWWICEHDTPTARLLASVGIGCRELAHELRRMSPTKECGLIAKPTLKAKQLY